MAGLHRLQLLLRALIPLFILAGAGTQVSGWRV